MLKLPGLIDPHVHLRGLPTDDYKEDFYTGTCAALAGGFTTVLDMPNNPKKPTLTYDLLREKEQIAKGKIVCNVGFFFGTNGNNLKEFKIIKDKVFGLKIFLSQSTGGLIVDFSTYESICKAAEGLLLVLHVEGNEITKAIRIAEQTGHNVHLCHVTSKLELEQVINAKKNGSMVTCGVNPHYLFLTEEDSQKQKGFAKMKPFLKTKKDQEFLWKNLNWIDVIESDHAPHSKEEKLSDNPPFGVTGLETTLPLLLTEVSKDKLTLEDIKRLCFENPAKIFRIAQDKNTYIEVDQTEEWQIDQEKLFTKAKISPFNGKKVKGKIKKVYIRGKKVFDNGLITINPGFGKILKSIL